MGYLHIDNLYLNKEILMFKQCYTLEKIHGSSSHITFDGDNQLHGHNNFFDKEELLSLFKKYFNSKVIVYGEIYGDTILKMRNTYGDTKKFIAFDVKIDGMWLRVPDAEDVCKKLNIEFVDYNLISTNLETINAERDKPSVQAKRNGIIGNKIREGIVLRPLIEMTKNNGSRIICKHKNDEFRETKTPRIVSNKELKVLTDANKIAEEWVTAERLNHVLDKIEKPINERKTGIVIKAMIEDVCREGKNEIVGSVAVKKTIGKKTSTLYFSYLKKNPPHQSM